MSESQTTANLTTAQPCSAPTSSPSSDSDAFNTVDARIHFGPLRSPEKKYLSMAARQSYLYPATWSSPIRRSPRLSTPQPQIPMPEHTPAYPAGAIGVNSTEDDTYFQQTLSSRPDTPDTEQALQDEPPSVLAIKISRAHDNPSPPPSPSTPMVLTGPPPTPPHLHMRTLFSHALLDSTSTSETDASIPPTPSVASSELSRDVSPVPPTNMSSKRGESQPDLICFEPFATPTVALHSVSHVAPTPNLPPSHNPSVDDLFSQSPKQPSISLESQASDILCEVSSHTVFTARPEYAHTIEDQRGENMKPEAIQETSEELSVVNSLLLPENITLSSSSIDSNVSSASGVVGDGGYGMPTQCSPSMQNARGDPSGFQPESSTEIRGAHATSIPAVEDQAIDSLAMSAFHRELGSLSPTSTGLLSSLVASSPSHPAPFSFTIPQSGTSVPGAGLQRHPFPSFSQQVLLQTPQRASPMRFASPSRSTAEKMAYSRLQPIALDDPNRTPARRIPIAEAIIQGHISPTKGNQMLASSRAGFEYLRQPALTIPPTDSPARRVELAETSTPAAHRRWQGIRFGSPGKAASKERAESVEPLPSRPPGAKPDRAGSLPLRKELSTFSHSLQASSSTTPLAPQHTKLPFPIASFERSFPAPVPEEAEFELDTQMAGSNKADPEAISRMKSSLKQMSSKIPRTTKPYGRPTSKSSDNVKPSFANTTLPASLATNRLSKAQRKVFVSDGSSGACSDDVVSKELAGTISRTAPTISNLKRKRVVAEKASPAKLRPVVLIRQVPRITQANAATTSKDGFLSNTVSKANKSQQIRRVVDKPREIRLVPEPQSEAAEPRQVAQSSTPTQALRSHTAPPGQSKELSSPYLQGNDSDNALATLPVKESLPLSSTDDLATPPVSLHDGVRRTTRARKPVSPTNVEDLFGTSNAGSLPRRKVVTRPAGRNDRKPSEMSATALRALTTSNTARNQRYLAATLETEVIRKEGSRPESPAVKIKTISQRDQDEKGKQRRERAERRARRGGVGENCRSEAVASSDSYSDSESDWNDEADSPVPKRHKRGPGDEDDYQTPVRKLRKLRLTGDEECELQENERRVKWDRGLFTTIYLDEVKLGSRQPLKDPVATKGCLAPTSKVVSLDNLGNLLYADAPLSELVQEKVVVKKFVYDNDLEALEEVIVVKNTRLRSRKAKS